MTKKKTTPKRPSVCAVTTEVEYHEMLARIMERFAAKFRNRVDGKYLPLFTTDAKGLFAAYLSALPAKDRQHHNCHACRDFMDRYGGLVSISPDGCLEPAVWDVSCVTGIYATAIAAVNKLVRRSRVTGVFKDDAPVWGKPVTGFWRHFAVDCGAWSSSLDALRTSEQSIAEKLEDYRNVRRALAEFTADLCRVAVSILEAEAMYRGEKVLGPARWLVGLHDAMAKCFGSSPNRDNVVWLAVATAPAGFCHPRSSMIGTLLEDLASGMSIETVRERFAAKMHPLAYQRPSEAPSAQTIEQAEKLVAKLGIASALARRYARLDDIEALWVPRSDDAPASASGAGVFAGLAPKGASNLSQGTIGGGQITWAKFSRDVLTKAKSMMVRLPLSPANYTALVTATDPDAKPILQWDTDACRNPVSWYMYHGGSMAERWNLRSGSMVAVTAVCLKPPQWHGGTFPNHSPGALFILEGCRDLRCESLALFPEILKAELHGIRSVTEAYSKTKTISGGECATACGILVDSQVQSPLSVIVTTCDARFEYAIDRWE